MSEVTIIGVDLAKNVFHLHGAAADGSVVFRKKLTRVQFHKFMSAHPACLVAMEACGSAHYRARAVAQIVPDWGRCEIPCALGSDEDRAGICLPLDECAGVEARFGQHEAQIQASAACAEGQSVPGT
jgi:hypothetical protein